ncbi:MAG: chloride channel protein [Polycyclovorans sp.]
MPAATSVRLLPLREALRLAAALVLTVAAAVLLAVAADAGQHAFATLRVNWVWAPLLTVPPLFVILVALGRRLGPGVLGGGVAQVLAAQAAGAPPVRGAVSLALSKTALTALAISGGASLGREGPAIQIGAALFRDLGSESVAGDVRQGPRLLVWGGIAGVAATFGAPLTALLFAIEVLRARFACRGWLLALLIAVAAAGAARALLPSIGVLQVQVLPASALLPLWSGVLLSAVFAGLLGGALAHALPFALRRARGLLQRYPLWMAAISGLALALVGLCGAGVHGAGLIEVRAWMAGEGAAVPGFAVLKTLATALSTFAAVPGGLVSPAVAIGAGIGVDVARLVDGLPLATAIALGMAAGQAAILRAPLASTALVLELLGDYRLLPPLLVAAGLATLLSRRLCRTRLLDALAQLARAGAAGAARC